MSIVKVDQSKCIGCGACVAIDPDNFDFNDDGLSVVIKEEATETAKEAEEACPVFAIDVVEGNEKEEEHSCGCCCCDCGDECESDCDCEDECDCGDECQCSDECACHKN